MMTDLAPLAYALALAIAYGTLAYMARVENRARRMR